MCPQNCGPEDDTRPQQSGSTYGWVHTGPGDGWMGSGGKYIQKWNNRKGMGPLPAHLRVAPKPLGQEERPPNIRCKCSGNSLV